ncbi:DeoR/GlpR family DNA-binding transcription regulator [Cryobacterium sp. SO1]|uniref:DeoR/GlpR family DNA-binding transcription regulator n=1 Tax=Cryobacterium sp. SO1 TaxID=1897061 RepID=UPI001023BE5F|nr:DeoR/GlpR family DNA-binding transcription regulator [Cryobacterium sp. SO1]
MEGETSEERDVAQSPRDGLTAAARRGELVRYIDIHSVARAEELAEAFAVSPMTIHRDLDLLSREGRIERIRGGARALPHAFLERDVRLRRATKVAEKVALARAAAALIRAGDVVAIDDSTTAAAILPVLAARAPSTVITHSLALMHDLTRAHPEIKLLGLGGQYYPETDSFLGTVVIEQIKRISADVAFISTTSVKNDALFHPDAESARTKQALVEMADRKVLLVDVTKFGAKGLHHVVNLDVFDDILVSADLAAEHRDQLDRLDVAVHYVPTPEP